MDFVFVFGVSPETQRCLSSLLGLPDNFIQPLVHKIDVHCSSQVRYIKLVTIYKKRPCQVPNQYAIVGLIPVIRTIKV